MKRHIKNAALTAAALLSFTGAIQAQNSLPTDAQQTCAVSKAEFNSWFADKTASKNGAVTSANSEYFPKQNTRCDFYKWSQRMFLWLASPENNTNSGSYTFDAEGFFDVSSETAKGRTLIPNSAPNNFTLRKGKVDTQAPFSEPIEEFGQAGGGGIILSQLTPISTGQSLVYYGVHVNDVYATFLKFQTDTAYQKANNLKPFTDFPNTPADMKILTAYAPNLDTPQAMIMELKTSWVDAATVKNSGDYITIQATVPEFIRNSSDETWTPTGNAAKKTLALVGMHVIGTVQDHPEMVWATFEHKNNAPIDGYYYNPVQGQIQTYVPQASGVDWLFYNADNPVSGFNAECAKISSGGSTGTIVSTGQCGNKITSSNIIQANPFGSVSSRYVSINDIAQVSANNTELISLGSSTFSMLNSLGDVRKNYIQMGAVWTQKGNVPDSSQKYMPPQPNTDPGYTMIGSLSLANSTMETFYQLPKSFSNGTNFPVGCFSCHSAFDSKTTPKNLTISHIYSDLIKGLGSSDK